MQKTIAGESKKTEASGLRDDPIGTVRSPLINYWRSQDEHQKYFNNNPNAGYGSIVIAPKILKFNMVSL